MEWWLKVLVTLVIAYPVWLAVTFTRAAIQSLRTGRPFSLRSHSDGAFPVDAEFGRFGAVVISGTFIAVAVYGLSLLGPMFNLW